jgi:hypothetical protein
MIHHNPLTEVIKKLKRNSVINSDQPDLTQSETIINQRQLIKFWVDHSKQLESENAELRLKLGILQDKA